MSRKRHPKNQGDHLIVRTLSVTLPSGFQIAEHEHPWAQLIYATNGIMTVNTEEGLWVVPSRRAVWVPAAVKHHIETTGSVTMRTLFLSPGLSAGLPTGCCVMTVSALLRELVLRAVEIGPLSDAVPEHIRLAGVVRDELSETREPALELRMPSDPRARRVAQRVQSDPGSTDSLQRLARGCGASPRTIERLFERELDMTFGRWRKQVKLIHALRLLADGASVTGAASEVGYESTSAFIAVFRRTLGRTPGQYYAGTS